LSICVVTKIVLFELAELLAEVVCVCPLELELELELPCAEVAMEVTVP